MPSHNPLFRPNTVIPCKVFKAKSLIAKLALALGLGLSAASIPTAFLADTPDPQNLMIVFDASGSMWGQIDGVTKIEIARQAFADAQSSLGAQGQNVGLIAYGHRRKGDCSDIETLVPLTQAAGGVVASEIQSLRPKGKTPLSDAIRLAARDMRYREDAATVVLFSDGIETCNADPCALAAELERDGINFTAHVIGFALSGDTDRAQLQCIADNTGGLFIEASDAAGLQEALGQVTQAPPEQPAPETATIPVRIVLKEVEGTVRPDQVSFRAINPAGDEKIALGTLRGADQVIAGLQADMPLGDWTIEAISDEGTGQINVAVTSGTEQIDVPFAAHATGFEMLAKGPFRLGVEHAFFLGVTDPLQANAEYTVALFPAGATDYNQRLDWETRFGTDGAGYTEHGLNAPDTAGDYEIVVLQGYDLGQANARFPIRFEDGAPIRWQGKTRAQPGEALPILISGDTYRNNTLSLRTPDGTEVRREWLQAYFTSDAGPVLTMPDTPGLYDLFYRATSEAEELRIGQITVGDVVQRDDPDAVAPPTDDGSQAAGKAQAPQTDLARARADHNAAMGEDPIFTQADLMGGWSLIVPETSQVIGVLAMTPQDSDGAKMDVLLYGGATTGLEGARQMSLPVTVITDDAGAVLAISGLADDLQIQLSRPPEWDGVANVFTGMMRILPTGQTLRVELF